MNSVAIVAELRGDLRRYRHNEPITARPPDTIYLAAKFLRRHWKLAATIAVLVVSITGAAVISTIMAMELRGTTLPRVTTTGPLRRFER